ncbi:AAA family ATPase [Roseococcus sp. DSY-14]|uniref:AAA family ATPase n=1 Tax=Roseococcus sp. DSY-14 TaxID=3369650 RepID=UPI00387AE5B2
MLVEHYGFREPPFLMTPDARLFYASHGHARAYAHLVYGIAQREGFIVVTGEVGAGKTTLIERLCSELAPGAFVVARVETTQVAGDDLLRLVARGFGAPSDGTKADVLAAIAAALREAGNEPGAPRHLLIVDEAQALAPAALEELRMLSNFTDNGRALLQTLLIGQPQLRRLIASPDLDQLRQRVLASYHLSGLTQEETRAYIEFRLRAVGWEGIPAWEEGALDRVHQLTGGIPRRINRLCSRVLLTGAIENAEVLSVALVESTAAELEEDLGAGLQPLEEPASGPAPAGLRAELDDLIERVASLERANRQRERVFGVLNEMIAVVGRHR